MCRLQRFLPPLFSYSLYWVSMTPHEAVALRCPRFSQSLSPNSRRAVADGRILARLSAIGPFWDRYAPQGGEDVLTRGHHPCPLPQDEGGSTG